MNFKKIAIVFALLLTVNSVFAQRKTVLEVYHGAECPHCHEELKWLESVEKDHPNIDIQLFEVWHNDTNADQWKNRLESLGQEAQGVPTNIIGEEVIVGFDKEALSRALGIKVASDGGNPISSEKKWEKYINASWPVMSLVLGLIDGFNPCAMWTLFMLISLLLVIEDKRKRWLIGGVFLITSGVIYGSALLTYLFGFKAITTLLATQSISWLFRFVGVIAVITGVITLYHAPKVGIECSVRDASSKRKFHKTLQTILERNNFWLVLLGIAGLAISVNAIELLCSFAIPTTFTATIVSLELPLYKQLLAVGLYDLMYMLDDVIVFSIAMYTLNLKVFSPKITKIMHVIGGGILFVLGILLLVKPALLTVF